MPYVVSSPNSIVALVSALRSTVQSMTPTDSITSLSFGVTVKTQLPLAAPPLPALPTGDPAEPPAARPPLPPVIVEGPPAVGIAPDPPAAEELPLVPGPPAL